MWTHARGIARVSGHGLLLATNGNHVLNEGYHFMPFKTQSWHIAYKWLNVPIFLDLVIQDKYDSIGGEAIPYSTESQIKSCSSRNAASLKNKCL